MPGLRSRAPLASWATDCPLTIVALWLDGLGAFAPARGLKVLRHNSTAAEKLTRRIWVASPLPAYKSGAPDFSNAPLLLFQPALVAGRRWWLILSALIVR